MYVIKSLQTRLRLYLVLPLILFLVAAGVLGYAYIRGALIKEWQEVAILRMARAANIIDLRLQEPLHWMQSFAQTCDEPHSAMIQNWLLKQLREHEGVSRVQLTWLGSDVETSPPTATEKWGDLCGNVVKVSPPHYFFPPGQELAGIRMDLLDNKGAPLGILEVDLKFDYLLKDILASGWMQTQQACLLDNKGYYLAHTDAAMKSRHCLGDLDDPLEIAMIKAMQEKPFDTIVGKGHNQDEVIGFYKLNKAPWVIMLHAQGSQILAPIFRFRLYYGVAGLGCIVFILALLHFGVRPVVSSIKRIARRAALVAQGHYGEPVPVQTRDEIGQLTTSFNEMVKGLQERDLISNTFGRYVDQKIAQELLSRPEASRLGGEKRPVGILFSDMRGFTPLAETMSPEATIKLVNKHFSRMIDIIQDHRGIIVDFFGDAILAFFDPWDGPVAPTVRHGLQCALAMQQAMGEMQDDDPTLASLQIGIGLHAGEVIVGNIGSETRAKYGIVGSAVNLTHRLQSQAQGGEVVISEEVYRLLQPGLAVKRVFRADLKGIKEPVTLYVVSDLTDMQAAEPSLAD
jgi:class 3 adenylate cyclase